MDKAKSAIRNLHGERASIGIELTGAQEAASQIDRVRQAREKASGTVKVGVDAGGMDEAEAKVGSLRRAVQGLAGDLAPLGRSRQTLSVDSGGIRQAAADTAEFGRQTNQARGSLTGLASDARGAADSHESYSRSVRAATASTGSLVSAHGDAERSFGRVSAKADELGARMQSVGAQMAAHERSINQFSNSSERGLRRVADAADDLGARSGNIAAAAKELKGLASAAEDADRANARLSSSRPPAPREPVPVRELAMAGAPAGGGGSAGGGAQPSPSMGWRGATSPNEPGRTGFRIDNNERRMQARQGRPAPTGGTGGGTGGGPPPPPKGYGGGPVGGDDEDPDDLLGRREARARLEEQAAAEKEARQEADRAARAASHQKVMDRLAQAKKEGMLSREQPPEATAAAKQLQDEQQSLWDAARGGPGTPGPYETGPHGEAGSGFRSHFPPPMQGPERPVSPETQADINRAAQLHEQEHAKWQAKHDAKAIEKQADRAAAGLGPTGPEQSPFESDAEYATRMARGVKDTKAAEERTRAKLAARGTVSAKHLGEIEESERTLRYGPPPGDTASTAPVWNADKGQWEYPNEPPDKQPPPRRGGGRGGAGGAGGKEPGPFEDEEKALKSVHGPAMVSLLGSGMATIVTALAGLLQAKEVIKNTPSLAGAFGDAQKHFAQGVSDAMDAKIDAAAAPMLEATKNNLYQFGKQLEKTGEAMLPTFAHVLDQAAAQAATSNAALRPIMPGAATGLGDTLDSIMSAISSPASIAGQKSVIGALTSGQDQAAISDITGGVIGAGGPVLKGVLDAGGMLDSAFGGGFGGGDKSQQFASAISAGLGGRAGWLASGGKGVLAARAASGTAGAAEAAGGAAGGAGAAVGAETSLVGPISGAAAGVGLGLLTQYQQQQNAEQPGSQDTTQNLLSAAGGYGLAKAFGLKGGWPMIAGFAADAATSEAPIPKDWKTAIDKTVTGAGLGAWGGKAFGPEGAILGGIIGGVESGAPAIINALGGTTSSGAGKAATGLGAMWNSTDVITSPLQNIAKGTDFNDTAFGKDFKQFRQGVADVMHGPLEHLAGSAQDPIAKALYGPQGLINPGLFGPTSAPTLPTPPPGTGMIPAPDIDTQAFPPGKKENTVVQAPGPGKPGGVLQRVQDANGNTIGYRNTFDSGATSSWVSTPKGGSELDTTTAPDKQGLQDLTRSIQAPGDSKVRSQVIHNANAFGGGTADVPTYTSPPAPALPPAAAAPAPTQGKGPFHSTQTFTKGGVGHTNTYDRTADGSSAYHQTSTAGEDMTTYKDAAGDKQTVGQWVDKQGKVHQLKGKVQVGGAGPPGEDEYGGIPVPGEVAKQKAAQQNALDQLNRARGIPGPGSGGPRPDLGGRLGGAASASAGTLGKVGTATAGASTSMGGLAAETNKANTAFRQTGAATTAATAHMKQLNQFKQLQQQHQKTQTAGQKLTQALGLAQGAGGVAADHMQNVQNSAGQAQAGLQAVHQGLTAQSATLAAGAGGAPQAPQLQPPPQLQPQQRPGGQVAGGEGLAAQARDKQQQQPSAGGGAAGAQLDPAKGGGDLAQAQSQLVAGVSDAADLTAKAGSLTGKKEEEHLKQAKGPADKGTSSFLDSMESSLQQGADKGSGGGGGAGCAAGAKVADKAASCGKSEAKSQSPSRVFMELGENMTLGLKIGMEEGVKGSFEQLGADMSTGLAIGLVDGIKHRGYLAGPTIQSVVNQVGGQMSSGMGSAVDKSVQSAVNSVSQFDYNEALSGGLGAGVTAASNGVSPIAQDYGLMIGYTWAENVVTGTQSVLQSSQFADLVVPQFKSALAQADLGKLGLLPPAGSGAQYYTTTSGSAGMVSMSPVVNATIMVNVDGSPMETVAQQVVDTSLNNLTNSISAQR
jgi:hypothetical protein